MSNIQGNVNQILSMAMIGGKLSGIPEAREKMKMSNTISAIDKEVADELNPLQRKADLANQAFREKESLGLAHEAYNAEKKYGEALERTGSLSAESQKLRRELMLKDPTEANIKAVALGEKAIERSKAAIESSLLRREALQEFIAKNAFKSKDPTGGKPDGK